MRPIPLILAAALLLAPVAANAQAAALGPLGPPGIPASRFPAPARLVATIISDRWANEDQRERAGEAAKVMDFLNIGPGMSVADVGAGSGYYVERLSQRIGPSGRVLAEDIMPTYLAALQRRVTRTGLANVQLGLGDAHDPRLPPASVDLVLMVHMYHEIEQPFGLLVNLLPALRPGPASPSWTPRAPPSSTAPRRLCWIANCKPSATAAWRLSPWKTARNIWRCSPPQPKRPRRRP